MVLLPLRRGDRIDRRGHAQPLGLAHDRRRGILRNHKAAVQPGVRHEEFGQFARPGDQFVGATLGDVAQLGQGDRQEIHRQSDRLSVEIARRDDHVLLGEDRRIVRRGVDFRGQHALHIVDRVLRGSVNLRHAAERIGVLHVVLGAGDQFAAFEQPADIPGRGELPPVGADQVHLVAERLDTTVEGV